MESMDTVTDPIPVTRGRGVFASPSSFARGCLRVAAVAVVIGIIRFIEPAIMIPLAGLFLAFAGLAWLMGTERMSDPPPPGDATEPGGVGSELRTFWLPAAVGASQVWLVGDFNGWSHAAHPMRRDGDWFTVTVELRAGQAYRYRYLLDGVRWENDWNADDYLPNEYGTEDSIART